VKDEQESFDLLDFLKANFGFLAFIPFINKIDGLTSCHIEAIPAEASLFNLLNFSMGIEEE
jgi:hypothetical protein